MSDLKDILKGSLERLGVAKQVEAVGVVERATEEIAKYIPREDFEVVSYKAGTLKILVFSAPVASEINSRKKEILKSLTIKEVIIKIN